MVRVNRRRGAPGKKSVATAKRAAKSLTKLQKIQVKKLVAAPLETKYIAAPTQVITSGTLGPVTGYSVLTNIVSGGTGITAWSLIPSLSQAIGSGVAGQVLSGGNQRQGNKVAGVTFKNDFQFYINTGLANNVTVDATVKLFICRAKQIRSNYNLTSLSPSTLLDNGDGTSVDWVVSTPNDALLNAMLPINKESFTVLKSYTFRIAKNQEAASGGTGVASPNMDSAHARTITYTHKHPSSLVYLDDNVAGTFDLPTNFNYFAFCVTYESQAGSLPANSILCNARNHMWFKDA
jgi:hypothetical protein